MALLTPSLHSETGYTESLTAATGVTGDTYKNTGREQIVVFNDSGSGINVVIDAVRPCEFGIDHDKTVTVGAHTRKVFGPYSPDLYATADTQLTKFTCSAVTSVTVGVIA